MNQKVPQTKQELNDFVATTKVSEDNKKLWLELWAKGYYVQAIGQLHIGEIDYLIVSTAPPAIETRQAYMGSPN